MEPEDEEIPDPGRRPSRPTGGRPRARAVLPVTAGGPVHTATSTSAPCIIIWGQGLRMARGEAAIARPVWGAVYTTKTEQLISDCAQPLGDDASEVITRSTVS